MTWACVLLLALPALNLSAEEARLIFSKSFPHSVPAFVEIAVVPSGAALYRDDPKDDNPPLHFQIGAADAAQMFALAEKLKFFTLPLESPAKVAFMGMKTFRYESGSTRQEVKFNYTDDPDGALLTDWFERISETEQTFITLQSAAKYDKLGVNKALLQLEAVWDKKRFMAPQQVLPILDRIAANETYLNMSRSRAAGVAESMRAAK